MSVVGVECCLALTLCAAGSSKEASSIFYSSMVSHRKSNCSTESDSIG